jgi:carbon starvation protein
MFGTANQLLGVVALSVGTTVIVNIGKARYAWVTLGPLVLLAVNTLWGAVLNITGNYFPMATGDDLSLRLQGWVLTLSSVIIIVCAVVILAASIRKWIAVLAGRAQQPATSETV